MRNVLLTNNFFAISKFRIFSLFLIVILYFISRFLFPFGDEPDFSHRAYNLVNNEHPFWSPYNILEFFINDLAINSECSIKSSPLSLWSNIDYLTCVEPFEQIIIRYLLILFILSPFLIMTLKKNRYYSPSYKNFDFRLDTLFLTFIFPSVILHLGFLSEEQFTLFLSFLIFLFWNNLLFKLALLFIIASLDIGSSIVITLFLFNYYIFNFLYNFNNSFTLSIFFMFIILSFAYLASLHDLLILSNIAIIGDKAEAIANGSDLAIEIYNKYPKILRPVITYMSATFGTPSGVKSIALYLFCMFASFIYIYKIIKKVKKEKK